MALALLTVAARHERRIRVFFSAPLAAGAFVPGLYVVTCTNAFGASPGVLAALAVPGSTAVAELQLADDLVPGGKYRVNCTAVPAVDASTATGAEPFTFGTPQAAKNAESARGDLDALLFGRDLVWTGSDYGETADGDLAVVDGLQNVCPAIDRRIQASGLAWDPTYGPNLLDRVDGPAVGASTARGAIVADILRDDRVTRCTAALTLVAANDGTTSAIFDINVELLGDRKVPSFTRQVN